MINRRNNVLFDIKKIKCELVFINKAKRIEQCEKIKILLNKEYNSISVTRPKDNSDGNDDNDNAVNNTKLFALCYNEREIIEDENSLMLFNNFTFTLFISIGQCDKIESFISIYNKSIAQIENKSKRLLSHLLILSEPNTATSPITQYSSINTNDHIHYCNHIQEEINTTLTQLLNTVLLCYYNQIISKPELLDSNGALVTKDYNEVKERCEEFIQIGILPTPLHCYSLLSTLIKIPTEQIKFRECYAITMFLIDYYSSSDTNNNNDSSAITTTITATPIALLFNSEIEKMFNEVFIGYQKAKQYSLLIESYIRLSSYYSLFKDKLIDCLTLIQRAYMESIKFPSKEKAKILLHCYMLLSDIGCKRKGCLYLYFAIAACYEYPQVLLGIIPYLFKEMNNVFSVYDIYSNCIGNNDSKEMFNAIHEEIYVNAWKKISFEEGLRSNSIGNIGNIANSTSRVNKKRIEKEYYLKVKRNVVQYDYILPGIGLGNIGLRCLPEVKWSPILYNIYLNLLTYYKGICNLKMTIAYTLSQLQILRGFLSQNDQDKLIKDHLRYSSLLQDKFVLNLPYMPILIKITPQCSMIKLDKKSKFLIEGDNKHNVFLYNPWLKGYMAKEEQLIANYHWTVNSIQRILIELFNPLDIPLALTQISILYEGEGSMLFAFPSNTTVIEPNAYKEVIINIRLLKEGSISIKGIKYEIENTQAMQWVDSNGNGILYNTDNITQDPYTLSINKKETIMLDNIQILPEIPLVDMTVLDDSSKIALNESLELYEYQCYTFSLLIENKSDCCPIELIEVFVYAYKKDDYKVLVHEETLCKENSSDLIGIKGEYVFNYNYIHKKKQKRIEFRLYYKYRDEVFDKATVKPFCYYSLKLQSKRLLLFKNIRTAPMLGNNYIKQLISNDTRIKEGYMYSFSSNKYYIAFDAFMLNDNYNETNDNDDAFTVKYNIIDDKGHLLHNGSIASNKQALTEISLIAKDVYHHLSDMELHWELINNNKDTTTAPVNDTMIKGCITLYNLITNELEYKFDQSLVFDIQTNNTINDQGIQCLLLKYAINNKSKTVYTNLRFYIYLFQFNESRLLFNTRLNPQIFYEGSLFYPIPQIKPKDKLEYTLILYPPQGEMIYSTCVLIDDTYKIIYLPSITKRCSLP